MKIAIQREGEDYTDFVTAPYYPKVNKLIILIFNTTLTFSFFSIVKGRVMVGHDCRHQQKYSS